MFFMWPNWNFLTPEADRAIKLKFLPDETGYPDTAGWQSGTVQ